MAVRRMYTLRFQTATLPGGAARSGGDGVAADGGVRDGRPGTVSVEVPSAGGRWYVT